MVRGNSVSKNKIQIIRKKKLIKKIEIKLSIKACSPRVKHNQLVYSSDDTTARFQSTSY